MSLLRLTPTAKAIRVECYRIVAAIRNEGGFKRPDFCEHCGVEDTAGLYGGHPETYLMAHHEDYAKPLEVNWLCQICHPVWDEDRRRRHPEDYIDNQGSNRGQRSYA